jgi:hypothetical protein
VSFSAVWSDYFSSPDWKTDSLQFTHFTILFPDLFSRRLLHYLTHTTPLLYTTHTHNLPSHTKPIDHNGIAHHPCAYSQRPKHPFAFGCADEFLFREEYEGVDSVLRCCSCGCSCCGEDEEEGEETCCRQGEREGKGEEDCCSCSCSCCRCCCSCCCFGSSCCCCSREAQANGQDPCSFLE